MIGLHALYVIAGTMFAVFAIRGAIDRTNPKRLGTALFWGLLALSFLAGDWIGDFGNGLLVLAMAFLVATSRLSTGVAATTSSRERKRDARVLGNRLFGVALVIPATALIGSLTFKQLPTFIDPDQTTLVALMTGTLLALAMGYVWLRPALLVPLDEGRRLMEVVGWAAILPQLLASLGAVFALAQVGDVLGGLLQSAMPKDSLLAAVVVFALGMALFTIIMGNAFAAFPVMATAIAIPVLIGEYKGDPAIVCAIGMLAGFCGTLLTPMAANFNIVPAVLLELTDRYSVIKAQIGTALPLLAFNIALLYWLAFR